VQFKEFEGNLTEKTDGPFRAPNSEGVNALLNSSEQLFGFRPRFVGCKTPVLADSNPVGTPTSTILDHISLRATGECSEPKSGQVFIPKK